ncbi:MAG: hypothetical protein JO107_08480 [Hyphomicrobiales bacterium]|nr:hypothetical protein [Hyphomicrobiales bacterium]MBV8663126.1 hypothetical protein [Hyphomicrobiales bacterium]
MDFDASKAREKLGWRHESTLDDLIAEMIREDLKVMTRLHPQSSSVKCLSHV